MSSSNFLPGRFGGPEANAKGRNFHYNTFFKFCQAKYCTKIPSKNFPKLCTSHFHALNRYHFTSLLCYRTTSPLPTSSSTSLATITYLSHRICARCADKSTYPLSYLHISSPYICAQYLDKITLFSLAFTHFFA